MGGFTLGLPFALPIISNASLDEEQPLKNKTFQKIKPKKAKNPNLLFLTLEGVPLRVLSCYGSKLMETPNIDRIAKEGMQFQNSFCNNALCAPSRATLLTGKYNHLAGQKINNTYEDDPTTTFYPPDQQTFPKLLKKAGYQTGMVGKWHLHQKDGSPINPSEVGFDYFSFKEGAGGPYYDENGFLENIALDGSTDIRKNSRSGYITDTMTDLAINGMKKFSKQQKPFLMAMQFFSVHRPFDPPHKYENLFDEVEFPKPGTFWDDYEDRSSAVRAAHMRLADMKDFDPPEDYTQKQLQQWNYQQLMRRFMGALKALDDNVGKLLDFLDNEGIADETIVVITGDHGFFLGEHGWFDKRFMYEPALRIPWLIRYPGVVKPGIKTEAWVQSIDNAPTILDMLGLPVPSDMQGKSLMPVFEKDGAIPEEWTDTVYYHYYEFDPPHFVQPNYGIRTERFKLIYYYEINEWELFDLERDPDEMENLFIRRGMEVKKGYEDIAADLIDQLKKTRKHYKDQTGKEIEIYPRSQYN